MKRESTKIAKLLSALALHRSTYSIFQGFSLREFANLGFAFDERKGTPELCAKCRKRISRAPAFLWLSLRSPSAALPRRVKTKTRERAVLVPQTPFSVCLGRFSGCVRAEFGRILCNPLTSLASRDALCVGVSSFELLIVRALR